eukprot:365016-Chlamydomonas_euryale.AAC.1
MQPGARRPQRCDQCQYRKRFLSTPPRSRTHPATRSRAQHAHPPRRRSIWAAAAAAAARSAFVPGPLRVACRLVLRAADRGVGALPRARPPKSARPLARLLRSSLARHEHRSLSQPAIAAFGSAARTAGSVGAAAAHHDCAGLPGELLPKARAPFA